MLNNISLSIITSDVVDDSVNLVLSDATIVTVTDDEHVEDHECHKHEHAESPQSRSWTHRLILPPRPSEDWIGSFRIKVPFRALIAAGMESLVTGFGSQARKKRAAFLARASTLYSFLFEDIARIERELGPTDAEAPEKGKQLW